MPLWLCCVQRKFEKLLSEQNVDLEALKALSWKGCPPRYRGVVWQLLLGYLPTNTSRRKVCNAAAPPPRGGGGTADPSKRGTGMTEGVRGFARRRRLRAATSNHHGSHLQDTLARKRKQYKSFVPKYYDIPDKVPSTA